MTTVKFNSKVLIDFVKCVEKAIKKPKYIHVGVTNGHLRFTSVEYDARVSLGIAHCEGKDLIVGVDATEFISTLKKLNEEELTLKLTKKKVDLTLGNVSASYSTVGVDFLDRGKTEIEGVELIREKVPWFLDSLVKCADSVETIMKDNLRFQDILLQGNGTTYMTRFTEAAVRILATDDIGFKGRIVIPIAAAKVAKAFKNQISECYIGNRSLTFVIKIAMEDPFQPTCMLISFPLMEDNYPEDCLSFLHLSRELPLIDTSKPGYWFNRDHLMQAIDLVSSVMKEEGQIKFEVVGQQENGFPVWKISSSNFKGSSCEEIITNVASGNLDVEPFWLNGKKAVKAIQSYGESIVFYNHSRSIFALANDNGNDLTLLSKSSG